MLNFKKIMIFVIVLCTALIVGACTSEETQQSQVEGEEASEPKELVVYHRLTGYCEHAEATVNKVMLEEYNTKVICENYSASEAYTKVLSERGNPNASVIIAEAGTIIDGIKEGIYEDLDPEIVTNLDHIHDKAKSYLPSLVATNFSTSGIVYRTDIFEEEGFDPPTKWEDLYRPEFKGRVGMSSAGVSMPFNLLFLFSHIQGEDLDNLDPAFEKIKELVDTGQVNSFYGTSSMQNQALLEGEIWIAPAYRFASLQMIDEGEPLAFVHPEDGFPNQFIAGAVIKDAPHQEEAQIFINLTLGKEFQEETAINMDTPVREDLDLPSEVRSAVLPDGWDDALDVDWAKISELRTEMYERWTREIESQ